MRNANDKSFWKLVRTWQNDLCAQRRLRSASASTHSDQSLRCALCVAKVRLNTSSCGQRRLVILGRCTGWSESSLGAIVISLILSRCGSSGTCTTVAAAPLSLRAFDQHYDNVNGPRNMPGVEHYTSVGQQHKREHWGSCHRQLCGLTKILENQSFKWLRTILDQILYV